MTTTNIDISLCPTILECDGDIRCAGDVCNAVHRIVASRWPGANISVQIGYRQGDERCRLDGEESYDVHSAIMDVDWSDESLYVE